MLHDFALYKFMIDIVVVSKSLVVNLCSVYLLTYLLTYTWTAFTDTGLLNSFLFSFFPLNFTLVRAVD